MRSGYYDDEITNYFILLPFEKTRNIYIHDPNAKC